MITFESMFNNTVPKILMKTRSRFLDDPEDVINVELPVRGKVRVAILDLLAKSKPLTRREIKEKLNLSEFSARTVLFKLHGMQRVIKIELGHRNGKPVVVWTLPPNRKP